MLYVRMILNPKGLDPLQSSQLIWNYLKKIQVAREISVKIFQLLILFFTSKTPLAMTFKSNLTIKLNLSYHIIDL